jgi:hypothetical protein
MCVPWVHERFHRKTSVCLYEASLIRHQSVVGGRGALGWDGLDLLEIV